MHPTRHLVRIALVLSALHGAAAAADELAAPGRKIFELRCQGCHEGTSPSAFTLGPRLNGIIGRKVGSESTGVHSRAALESDTVWTRSSLRRFLSNPQRQMPGTLMTVDVPDPKDLDNLLNYLQTLK